MPIRSASELAGPSPGRAYGHPLAGQRGPYTCHAYYAGSRYLKFFSFLRILESRRMLSDRNGTSLLNCLVPRDGHSATLLFHFRSYQEIIFVWPRPCRQEKMYPQLARATFSRNDIVAHANNRRGIEAPAQFCEDWKSVRSDGALIVERGAEIFPHILHQS